jgi:CRP-like cAMP-binding protein
MTQNANALHAVLTRKLDAFTGLSQDEKRAITELPFAPHRFKADQDVAKLGDVPHASFTILEGWACRYKMVEGGRRQIMSFHVPGDLPDLQTVFLPRLDHSIAAITPLTVAFIQHRDLRELIRKHDGIARALWRDALVEAAIFREWMVGIGRRSAHERIAHLLCEMATKLQAVGLFEGETYAWPVTQVEVADALGLTDVHVNRVLRDLKKGGLLTLKRGSFTVQDWPALKALGQFDPLYLHLNEAA